MNTCLNCRVFSCVDGFSIRLNSIWKSANYYGNRWILYPISNIELVISVTPPLAPKWQQVLTTPICGLTTTNGILCLYRWNGRVHPQLPACHYINNVFIWASQVIGGEDFSGVSLHLRARLIGRDGIFPEDFVPVMRTVFKKLFRVYAHVYHHHLNEFIKRNAEVHLNTSFKYFGLFVREFGLISKKEEAPLRKLLQEWNLPAFAHR